MKNRVLAEITAPSGEKILNHCAQCGICLFGVKIRETGVLRLWLDGDGAKALTRHCPPWMTVTILRETRQARAGALLRRRKRVLALLVCTVLCVWVLSLFIWDIEVTGNETVSRAEILRELERYGVREGAFRFGIDQAHITNGMLLQITELSWITVNPRGSRISVLVREERPAPDMEAQAPAEIAAARGGIIQRITPLEGFACVSVGDVVEPGQLLIAAEAETAFHGTRTFAASGEVMARTTRQLAAAAPLLAEKRTFTGETTRRYAVKFGTNRLNLYFDSGNPYAECVKITEETRLQLPGAGALPLSLICERFDACALQPREAPSVTEEVLRESLHERLEEQLSEGGRILREEYETEETGGVLTVTLRAECLEDIAAARSPDAGNQTSEE